MTATTTVITVTPRSKPRQHQEGTEFLSPGPAALPRTTKVMEKMKKKKKSVSGLALSNQDCY